MIAMTVASILLVGVTAGYSALAQASRRLAVAQTGISKHTTPQCRPTAEEARAGTASPETPYRCGLPERCEYDTVSQSCRATT